MTPLTIGENRRARLIYSYSQLFVFRYLKHFLEHGSTISMLPFSNSYRYARQIPIAFFKFSF